MNKGLLIAIVVGLLLFGGVAIFNVTNNNTSESDIDTNSTQEDTTMEKTADNDENSGVVESIRDAFTSSASLKCDYEEEDTKATAYIKNGAVRFDSQGYNGQFGGMIHKDDTTWVWNSEDNSGFIFRKSVDAEEMPNSDNSNLSDKDQVIDSIEAFKEHCTFATVSDSMFTPPSDIDFFDMEEFKDLSNPEKLRELQDKFAQ